MRCYEYRYCSTNNDRMVFSARVDKEIAVRLSRNIRLNTYGRVVGLRAQLLFSTIALFVVVVVVVVLLFYVHGKHLRLCRDGLLT